MRTPGLALRLSAAALALALACSGDAPEGSASDGTSTTAAGETTTGEATTTTTTTGEATTTTGETTTGEACVADMPFTQNIAKDADTYDTCGLPFYFYAKRRQGTASVERCSDESCASCDPMLAYELDTGSTFAVPEEVCLQIAHETVDVAGACTTRGLTMWRLDQGGTPPILVVTAVTPEAPASLEPKTLTVSLGDRHECTCDAAEPWCCVGMLTTFELDFAVDGQAPVSVAPGFINYKQLAFAGATYEVVVTQSLEAPACGQDVSTGWYMRRL